MTHFSRLGRRSPSAIRMAMAGSILISVLTGCASSGRSFDPKHDGRFKRIALTFPITPFVYAWMGFHILTEDRGPRHVDFARAIQYDPVGEDGLGLTSGLDEHTRNLVRRFAPIVVQELPEAPDYAPSIDRIGTPRPVTNGSGEKEVRVSTEKASMYYFTSVARIHDSPRLQLNYVYWFSEHPKSKGLFDPEAGKIEGLTFRITLNGEDEPLFYETIYNCGCYHRVYPAESVERMALAEFGDPKKGFFTAVQKKIRRKIDLFAPEHVPDRPGERLVIFSQAGRHMPLSIKRESDIAGHAKVTENATVDLQPYDALERGGRDGLGIFNSDSLVAGSDRAETWMLFPTGLYHAGTPRRRGAQLIHFDQYDFDDPELLEKNLRLPSKL